MRTLVNTNYERIVLNIKQLIQKKGMKQGVVAERSGFTESEFSNMLNERRKLIRIEYMSDIAKALGVTPNELYGVEKTQELEEEV